jgi:hypothetical protein
VSGVLSDFDNFLLARDPPGIMPSRCLAQQVKVGFAAGTGIDNGRQVAGKIEGITLIVQSKTKRKFQSHFWFADELSVMPFLPVEDHAALLRHGIDKRFEVGGKPESIGYDAGK